MTPSSRRPRTKRVKSTLVALQDWDLLDAFPLIGLCGYVTADQIARATGRSLDRARRRLRQLFDAGYLDFTLVSSTEATLISLKARAVAEVRQREPELAARLRRVGPIAYAGVDHHLGVVDARLYAVAWGTLRTSPLVRWANAGGDVAREIGLPSYRVEPDGLAEFASPGGPRYVAVEVDCAATEPGSVLADKLARYANVFEDHRLDRLWVIVKNAGVERQRTVAALVARHGLDAVVCIADHAAVVARPVVDIEAAGGADGAEGPNTRSRAVSVPEGFHRG